MAFYTFLPKILNMSLTASVAIVFVLLLRLLLKKAPKVISYALWAVVLIRLLCPVSIESGLSLFGLFDTPTVDMTEHSSAVEYIPSNIVHTEFPEVVLPVPGVGEAITEVLPQGEEQLRADPLEGPMFIATYIWWGGILVMAIYGIVTYLRLRRRLITASPLRDNIYLADDIDSPFVMGLFQPKIYLPSAMEEREQSYILLHEQHHIRRLDHVVKALAFVALCIHWFNPLVWLAFILSGKDMEMSCDEAVVRKLGTQIRADYTASLLSLATGKRIIAGMPLAFGEGNTKGRIRNLAKWKKPAFWVVLVAVIACIVLAVCLLTNPETKQDLSFLNYENLVSVAAQSDTHPASKSDDQSRYIIDGPQLAKLLDTSKWIAQTGITRNIQRDTDKNSKSSIQITLNGTYLKVFDTDTANIYDPTTGKDRYYRMADGDYEKLLAMLSLDSEGTADDAVAGKTYLYENEGIGGSFTITLYDDGTFTYYEGMASSYIGVGSWEQDGNSITMTDDGHGGYGLVNHFKLDGDDLVFVDKDSANFVYVKVQDGEKFNCTGEAFKQNDTTAIVTKWFDYLEAPDEMKWDGSIGINLPEFPDVTFRWSYGEIVAVKGNKTTSLYTGMPIWNTYFCDLSGDGLPELCSTISWGSGMIDNRVIIYDYANGVSYSLEDRGFSDYTLRQDESDGQLYVDKTAHVGGGLLSTGRLVFEDDCLQVLWPEKPNDNIREITDPTDDPNFAYDTAVERIYEDDRNEYFISGLYSQHIIVQYADGTQEDVVTALNAGRATFADLDKFGIRYWAEPKPTSFDIAENTVAEIGRGTLKSAVELSDEDAAGLLSLIESGYWVEAMDTSDCKNDCAVNLGGRLIYYCSECGTFTEYRLSEMSTTSHQTTTSARFWTMPLADQLFVNNILCKYIDLMYGITDVTAPGDDEESCRFYLTIGAEGVKSIELSMPGSSGGCENADGSLFKKGERIWLENLDGYNDLRGLTITALGKNAEIIWSASIPNTAENNGFTHLTQDDWVITNIE